MRHIVVGTAGHIDHGKTSLVKALTGIDTDRLKEEKARGITIDLGFADLRLDDDTTLAFVDVPGHERFIKTMLAGVAGIDVVMLVVAGDESVMPQTREHLDICSLLHVQKGLTVITKADAVERDLLDLVEIEVQEFLAGSFLEGAPIVRVSAATGEGMPQLLAVLKAMVPDIQPRDAGQIFRIPVDRCFTMKGFGPVAAGTLVSGRVRRDDDVEVLPARQIARVRGVQVHGHQVEEAHAGQRTALNLQRIDLADLSRGMVLTVPGVFTPSATFDVEFELLATAEAAIPSRKRIRFHTGTTELIGHLVLLGQDTLEPGGRSLARIRLEKPTFALPGDRFIIRQYSPMTTLGGGEILDIHPPKGRRSAPALTGRLRALKTGSRRDRVLLFITESGAAGIDETQLVARTGLAPGAMRSELQSLAGEGRIRVAAESPLTVVEAGVFSSASTATLAAIRAFHAAEPLVKGIGREDLKARAVPESSSASFRAVLDHLVDTKAIVVDHDVVHQYGRAVTLTGIDESARAALAARFTELGLQVPPPDELAATVGVDRTTARKIIQLMIKEDVLVKVNESMIVDRRALEKLVQDIRSRKAVNARLGVGDFKELTGLSRKFAVPLLEYLDGQRVTRRMGDERVIL